MINTIQIAWRFLIGRHSSGLISFSFYLSIIGLAIGTASLLLISSFSNGFSEKVQSKLASIDGEVRIEKYGSNPNSYLSEKEIIEIKDSISKYTFIESFSTFSQTQAMLQSGQQSDGTLLFGISQELLLDLSSESTFHLTKEAFIGKKIVLGTDLAENLGLTVGDIVNVFDLNLLTTKKQIKGINVELVGTIKTGFSEYDKTISFIPENTYQQFYDTQNSATGILLNIENNSISNNINKLREKIRFPYMVNSWKDRHSVLLQWMSIYHIPIQLVMGFITLLAIFNISSTLWMISLDKTKNIGILKALGYTKTQVRNIFLLKGIIIGLIGITSGFVLSLFILILQSKFHIISLSSEVYFLDYLPVSPNFKEFSIIIMSVLITTILFSFIPANNVKNVIPAKVLKED